MLVETLPFVICAAMLLLIRYSPMVSNKEQKAIVRQLTQAGWRVEKRSSHVLAFPPDGESRPIIIGNPSDHRTVQNMLSNIAKLDPKLKGKIKVS